MKKSKLTIYAILVAIFTLLMLASCSSNSDVKNDDYYAIRRLKIGDTINYQKAGYIESAIVLGNDTTNQKLYLRNDKIDESTNSEKFFDLSYCTCEGQLSNFVEMQRAPKKIKP